MHLTIELSEGEAGTLALAAERLGIPVAEFLRFAGTAQARQALRATGHHTTSVIGHRRHAGAITAV
ncbi:hypothetical protein [Actinomycetospora flava]|uniref:DUF1778 domain-containing protein n=1 Tax=Actinomycetospora flava TaxID=3129232 RepID=A0ABU8M5P2_9PSEU